MTGAGRTGPRRDPVLLAEQIAVAILAVIALVLLFHAFQHAQAEAAHPCPSWNFPVLAPTGWGCAETLTITGKSR